MKIQTYLLSLVVFSTLLFTIEGQTDGTTSDEQTTTPTTTTTTPTATTTTPTTTTTTTTTPTSTGTSEPTTTLGPNDLVATDYIIIGVTSVTLAGMLIGGTYYTINLRKKQKLEKQEMYKKYLHSK